MSYMQYLPPELLSYILELACASEPPAQSRAAAVLGRVSKLWREIIFSTPAIWTTFQIPHNHFSKGFDEPLSRSGSMPIDIYIADEETQLRSAREQLKALIGHSSRWRNVEISHPVGFDLLGKSIPLTLPQLRSLKVDITAQKLSPALFYFYSFPEYSTASDIDLQWCSRKYPSLRYLDLSDVELRPQQTEDFLSFLEAHDGLERLALKNIWECHPYAPSQTVVLPKLRDLELRGITSSEILLWVSTPSLHKLTIEKHSQLKRWTPVDIKSNYASATDVTLIRFSTSPDTLRNLLNAIPLATHLNITSTDLRAPDSFTAESVLLEHKIPNLTSLHIQGVSSPRQAQAVAKAYCATLKDLRVHCLDLGLPRESSSKEYEEMEDASTWLKSQTAFKFGIDHSENAHGVRYRRYEDQISGAKMVCQGSRCGTLP
ncbi:hypothetical protein FRB90_004450 [Tulasnella sp. 427]|nr:hypothetical protein FRB90_004450 [Tulasnella sp. 427]